MQCIPTALSDALAAVHASANASCSDACYLVQLAFANALHAVADAPMHASAASIGCIGTYAFSSASQVACMHAVHPKCIGQCMHLLLHRCTACMHACYLGCTALAAPMLAAPSAVGMHCMHALFGCTACTSKFRLSQEPVLDSVGTRMPCRVAWHAL